MSKHVAVGVYCKRCIKECTCLDDILTAQRTTAEVSRCKNPPAAGPYRGWQYEERLVASHGDFAPRCSAQNILHRYACPHDSPRSNLPHNYVILRIITQLKQSHYRPGQTQRVLREFTFPDFVTTAKDGGMVNFSLFYV